MRLPFVESDVNRSRGNLGEGGGGAACWPGARVERAGAWTYFSSV